MSETITAGMPKQRTLFEFTMTEDYTPVDERGVPGDTYHEGLTYNVREGNEQFILFAWNLIQSKKAVFGKPEK